MKTRMEGISYTAYLTCQPLCTLGRGLTFWPRKVSLSSLETCPWCQVMLVAILEKVVVSKIVPGTKDVPIMWLANKEQLLAQENCAIWQKAGACRNFKIVHWDNQYGLELTPFFWSWIDVGAQGLFFFGQSINFDVSNTLYDIVFAWEGLITQQDKKIFWEGSEVAVCIHRTVVDKSNWTSWLVRSFDI